MSGAMSNLVHKCELRGTDAIVILVRVHGTHSTLVNRSEELRTFMAVAAAGMGPQMLVSFTNGWAEQFLTQHTTLTAKSMRTPKVAAEVAKTMANFHFRLGTQGRLYSGAPEQAALWDRMRSWAKLSDNSCSEQNSIKGNVAADIDALERGWGALHPGCWLAPCHNDLQYGNIMGRGVQYPSDDDCYHGPRGDDVRGPLEVQFIDYEYACINPVAFDIANHWCEWTADYHSPEPHVLRWSAFPDTEQQTQFVAAYLRQLLHLAEQLDDPAAPALSNGCMGTVQSAGEDTTPTTPPVTPVTPRRKETGLSLDSDAMSDTRQPRDTTPPGGMYGMESAEGTGNEPGGGEPEAPAPPAAVAAEAQMMRLAEAGEDAEAMEALRNWLRELSAKALAHIMTAGEAEATCPAPAEEAATSAAQEPAHKYTAATASEQADPATPLHQASPELHLGGDDAAAAGSAEPAQVEVTDFAEVPLPVVFPFAGSIPAVPAMHQNVQAPAGSLSHLPMQHASAPAGHETPAGPLSHLQSRTIQRGDAPAGPEDHQPVPAQQDAPCSEKAAAGGELTQNSGWSGVPGDAVQLASARLDAPPCEAGAPQPELMQDGGWSSAPEEAIHAALAEVLQQDSEQPPLSVVLKDGQAAGGLPVVVLPMEQAADMQPGESHKGQSCGTQPSGFQEGHSCSTQPSGLQAGQSCGTQQPGAFQEGPGAAADGWSSASEDAIQTALAEVLQEGQSAGMQTPGEVWTQPVFDAAVDLLRGVALDAVPLVDLHWGLWGLAQASSTIAFSYDLYAQQRLEHYRQGNAKLLQAGGLGA